MSVMKYIVQFLLFLWIGSVPFVGKAQEKDSYTVSGTVMTETGSPLPGVTVIIKNEAGVGTATNSDGVFSLKDVGKNSVLVFSFIGYENQEVLVTEDMPKMKIVLKESKENLEEVVIVGHGSQRKISVVGAVTTIEPEMLQVPSTSITNMMGGRIPGIISVTRSGEPGKDFSEFWIRGISTFGANQGALVLIDGVEGDLNDLDPADIESFSILKDASATAVYGVRGANGVVVVTTHRGKAGKLNINLKTNATLSYSPRMPKYLGAYDYARLANEARVVRG